MASSDRTRAGGKTFAIVAGEESGDYLGAELIVALRRHYPDARFVGIGGQRMEALGMQVLYPMETISLVGLDGLFTNLAKILSIRRALTATFIDQSPDMFIGIDVPDFNLTLEARLRAKKIPTVHYVGPTVWAWRGYRIKKIKRAVDHMLTLFPFETAFYRRHEIPVTFVGHPIADEIDVPPSKQAARRALNLPADAPTVALLPGSRRSEVRRHARLFVDTARRLTERFSDLQLLLAYASPDCEQMFKATAGDHPSMFHGIMGRAREAMSASDVVLLASGTATLEAALLRRPMVVTYKVSRTTEWMVKLLGDVEHYAMPNHLMPEPLVPEFMQAAATPEKLTDALTHYLTDREAVTKVTAAFEKMHLSLRGGGNETAAGTIVHMLDRGLCA